MNIHMKIFRSQHFDPLRVVMLDDEPWYIVTDVAAHSATATRPRLSVWYGRRIRPSSMSRTSLSAATRQTPSI